VITEKFKEVLAHEGVVSIVSWAENDAHVVNTWNSYVLLVEDDRLLLPVYGMRETEKNIVINSNVKLTFGSREVEGFRSPGAGFLVTGTARFITEGETFEDWKTRYSWITRLLEVKLESVKQTL